MQIECVKRRSGGVNEGTSADAGAEATPENVFGASLGQEVVWRNQATQFGKSQYLLRAQKQNSTQELVTYEIKASSAIAREV